MTGTSGLYQFKVDVILRERLIEVLYIALAAWTLNWVGDMPK